MVTQVISGTTVGIEGHKIIVETDIAGGVPAIIMVGLPDTAMNEARERIRGAFRNSNIDFPIHKVVINLAPADLKKEGSLYRMGTLRTRGASFICLRAASEKDPRLSAQESRC